MRTIYSAALWDAFDRQAPLSSARPSTTALFETLREHAVALCRLRGSETLAANKASKPSHPSKLVVPFSLQNASDRVTESRARDDQL